LVKVDLRPLFSPQLRQLSWFLIILLTLTTLLAAASPFAELPVPSPISPALAPGFGVLPLSFIPNAGQIDPAARFQAHAMGGTLFFTPDEVVLSLPAHAQQPAANHQQPASPGSRSSLVVRPSSVIRLHFEGANPTPQITGTDRLPGIVNYFIGNDPASWHTELPTYREIVYRELYPGVDLHYAGTTQVDGHSLSLKGTYTVAPGADPTRIRWRYEGATGVWVDEATGDLRIDVADPSPTLARFSNY
jgi:hypothetical protein